ncbi:RimK/LysX family protein [Antarcticibacterium sp. 1MA-6-2]|uniref:ATP-dependent zinc protease family protein n=1 Tax=Antarcticibacterium sp. 1MA-6-2 TaxID=2908210 RepID=UPI001F26BF39|nr:RimK/LysX family protein [Antarcticibacterium sp. 1MA-6-2]UJH90308.1 RimK/LysX family protein [Antarcticibacterium sp. 1MA-6-2]
MDKKVIGRVDKADFPLLNLEDVAIKIDTGAYTSSIHCDNIVEKEDALHCTFLDEEHPLYNGKEFIFKDYDVVFVRSSNGIMQQRYQVQSTIKIFGKIFKISLSLSARQEMRYPVLIGRKFLTKKFIVDPELTDVSFNLKTNEHKNSIKE